MSNQHATSISLSLPAIHQPSDRETIDQPHRGVVTHLQPLREHVYRGRHLLLKPLSCRSSRYCCGSTLAARDALSRTRRNRRI
jgi:hypothetical protein